MEEWALALVGSPWVFVITYLLCLIDGFFPPVPSESVVIALAALSISVGSPNLWLVGIVAALGAFCGDQIAYLIGRKLDIPNTRIGRTPRGARVIAAAGRSLERRGVLYIFAARYVPIGRVAVNMTAGSIRYPHKRFVVLTFFSAWTWSLYSIALGLSAGSWFENHPVVAMIVGVSLGVAIGIAVDQLITLFQSRRAARARAGCETGVTQLEEP